MLLKYLKVEPVAGDVGNGVALLLLLVVVMVVVGG